MRNIGKLYILFAVTVLFTNCQINHSVPKNNKLISIQKGVNFLNSGFLIEGYQHTYLRDPTCIQDLLRFLKLERLNEFYNTYLKGNIRELEKNKGYIKIRVKDKRVELLFKDTLVFGNWPIFSCEELGSIVTRYPDYIRGVHSFKKNKEPVKKKINEEIQYGLRKIFQYYSKVDLLTLDNGEASFMIVEYLASMNKLINRTGEKYDYLLKEPYFQDLKMYFEAACKKYNLSRIVYSTRIWTK